MAHQWSPQPQQAPNQGYGSGQYQQQYPQQAYGHPGVGQPYGGHGYAQPQPAQQQYSQSCSDQNVQAQAAQTSPEQSQQQHAQQPHSQPQHFQYGPQQQYSAFNQPVVPTVQSTLPMQPSHNACFNCGALDHWAQNCPHPKRDSNTGMPNSGPAAKRQKFNAPVVTKYPVPPHVAQAQAAQQAWRPSAYGHPGYPQYQNQQQVPYGPPTPMSANQTPNNQWISAPQYAQGASPAYFQQQTGAHQQYPHPPPTPNPNQYYGSHPSTQASPQGHYGPQPQPQFVQHQQPPNTQVPPYSTAPAHSASPSASALGSHFPSGPAFSPRHAYHGPPSSSSNHSQISTPMPQPRSNASPEPEGDDLTKLDVPDMPSVQGDTPATLVGRPLPTNFVVADALAPFAPPGLGDNGLCKSKYLDRADANHSDRNVKDTDEWNNHQKDPIFATLSDHSKLIPLNDLDAIYRPHQRKQESSEEPDTQEDSRQSDGNHARSANVTDFVDSSETELDDRSHKGHSRDGQHLRSRKRSLSQSWREEINTHDKEELSAAHKKNPESMHARPSMRPYPPPTPQERSDDNRYGSLSRSTSPKRHAYDSNQYVSPPDSGFDGQRFDGKPHPNRRDSHLAQEFARHRSDQQQSTNVQRPPPPPPPPLRKTSWYDGSHGSPPSAGPSNGNPNPFEPDADDFAANGDPHNQANGRSAIDTPTTVSPIKLRSERSYGRKREYSLREASSDENETPARRQADDVTPKLKRRQPKVAAAYSRRW